MTIMMKRMMKRTKLCPTSTHHPCISTKGNKRRYVLVAGNTWVNYCYHHHVCIQLALLQYNKLSPSSAEWKVMEVHGYLPPIERLIGMVPEQSQSINNCTLTSLQVNQDICSNSNPTNEGQPTLLCGNLITHIVQDANTVLGRKVCKFEIFPKVTEEADRRENKESDYSIFRIMNRITYVIVEVKLSIGRVLTRDDEDKLAQLFLEAIYTFSKEGKSPKNETLLCVLTDGTTWHMILTDMTCSPLKFKSLCSLSTFNIQAWDSNISEICDHFVKHIKTCYGRD